MLCVLFLPLCLTGCGTEYKAAAEQLKEAAVWITEEKMPEKEMQEKGMPEKEIAAEKVFHAEKEIVVETVSESGRADLNEMQTDGGLPEEKDAALLAAQYGNYSFEQLTQTEQLLYIDIVRILSQAAKDVEIRIPEGCETEEGAVIGRVFQCVMNDHPEFFYVDGYRYTRYTQGAEDGALLRVTFSGSYTMSPAKRQECEEKIRQYTAEALAPLQADWSDYEKVKYIYEYIIRNTEYNLRAKENQNICSVFLYGESVCQGYARATQYLLKQAGIPCTVVNGSVKKEGHAWNLVRIDGEYYYVDPTWGDASYKMGGDEQDAEKQKVPGINYDYLCVTTGQLLLTHELDNVVELPECTAETANYYRMEDAYFTGYDRERIGALFARAYERGEEAVTLKCSDAVSYEEVKRMLIDAQEVFGYLREAEGKVAYTDNHEQLSISFWL